MGADVGEPRGRPDAAAAHWSLDPPTAPADIPVLCARLTDLVGDGPSAPVVVCDVRAITEPTALTVDALARLRLTARRLGADLQIRGAPRRLRQLLAFAGLSDVIPMEGGSALEPQRQTEQGKQPVDVEEAGDLPDPAR